MMHQKHWFLCSKDINFDGVADITYPDSSKDNSKQVGDSQ